MKENEGEEFLRINLNESGPLEKQKLIEEIQLSGMRIANYAQEWGADELTDKQEKCLRALDIKPLVRLGRRQALLLIMRLLEDDLSDNSDRATASS